MYEIVFLVTFLATVCWGDFDPVQTLICRENVVNRPVLYHTALPASDIGAVVKFSHIFCQSDGGHSLAIRISCGVEHALCIVCKAVLRRVL